MTYWDYFAIVLIGAGQFVAFIAWLASIIWTFSVLTDYRYVWWLWRVLAGLYMFFALVAGVALFAQLARS